MRNVIIHSIALLIAFTSLSCFAQDLVVIDTVKLKCSYEYKYLLDTTAISNKRYSTLDILHLQIGSKSSKCISYRTYQVDSISAYDDITEYVGNILRDAYDKGLSKREMSKLIPKSGMRTKVYKNYPDGKMTITDNVLSDYYLYEEEMNIQEWNLHDESVKTILGYECQKATCTFRGREWTAWFALDIPISDGPWKFSGLPGLIMEVYDKGEQQYFCINGLQQVAAEPLYFGTDGKDISIFQKVKRTDLLKFQYKFFRDPDSFNQIIFGMSLGHNKIERKRDLLERE